MCTQDSAGNWTETQQLSFVKDASGNRLEQGDLTAIPRTDAVGEVIHDSPHPYLSDDGKSLVYVRDGYYRFNLSIFGFAGWGADLFTYSWVDGNWQLADMHT